MDRSALQASEWKNSSIQVFWGEIAPCDHLVQIYENDNIFLNTLEGFMGCGFLSGDSVVTIATDEHINLLNERLTNQGFDIEELKSRDQYIPIDVAEALSTFMVNNWPDEQLFNDYISKVIHRATRDNRKVRAFGEMVALLWQQGHNGATVKLEHLWNRLHSKDRFSLYCAYPQNGFTQNASDSLESICKAHSKIIDGQSRPSTEIYYKHV